MIHYPPCSQFWIFAKAFRISRSRISSSVLFQTACRIYHGLASLGRDSTESASSSGTGSNNCSTIVSIGCALPHYFFQGNLPRTGIHIKSVPIPFFRNLFIQWRPVFSDIVSFVCADLFYHIQIVRTFGIIDRFKPDTVSFPLGFGQYPIFMIIRIFDTGIMLRKPPHHISAFADIDDYSVYRNSVNTSVVKRRRIAVAFQPVVHILCIIRQFKSPP